MGLQQREMAEELSPLLSLDEIKEYMDKTYSLVYVDYRDDLSESMEAIQKHIHGKDSAVDEIINDWYWEQQADSVAEIIKDLQKEIESDLDMEEGDLDATFEEYEDELRDIIYERDDSDALKDLIRNTSDPVMFYDTGMEIGNYTDPIKERLHDVKKGLRIPQKNKDFDKLLTEMCHNASYGGQLVVYFRGDLSDWIRWDTDDYNIISFSDQVSVAIVDHWNGSGGDTTIKHHFTLPYEKENVFIDKTIKYNYTYEVCGMSSDWCDGTSVVRGVKKTKLKAKKSPINDHLDQEAIYNATFKAGKCTLGDTDIRRHRHAHYVNEYPMGNRCADCGHFWID